MNQEGSWLDAVKSIGKSVGRFLKKTGKRYAIIAVVFFLAFILLAGLFWGVVDEAFKKMGDVSDSLKASVQIQNRNIVIPSDFTEQIKEKLEAVGLKSGELNLGGNLEYLSNWFEAEIVTSYPRMGGNGLQGVITLKRGNSDGTSSSLTYTELTTLREMIANQSQEARGYFSMEGDNFILAKSNISPDGTTTLEEYPFNYKMMVSPYSTPFEFFVALCLITQNPEFVDALATYTKNTTIEITVLESLTTLTTTTQISGKRTISTYTAKEGKALTEPVVTEEEFAEAPVTESSYFTAITPIITEARTLFLEKTVEPIFANKTQNSEPMVGDEPDQIGQYTLVVPEGGQSSQVDTYQKVDLTQVKKTSTTTSGYQTWQAGTTNSKDNTDAFLSFIISNNGEIPELIQNKVKLEGNLILYKVPGSAAMLSPKENLVTGAEFLFKLLSSNERTQIYETIMRYILYRLTGKSYGVTSLDLNIFGSDSFLDVSAGGMVTGLSEYLRQFSHSGEAPASSDGKYYLMYVDGEGWPTIGNADIQWKSHHSSFAKHGKVQEAGQEKSVDNVEAYVGTKLARGQEATYSNAEIKAAAIYIEKELVDSVGENLRSVYLNKVESSTTGLSLSTQQKWALTAIAYNFGHLPIRNGKTFKTVYQEGAGLYEINSWEHNRYIWDNWWSQVGGGEPGHIPSRDAAFETYVKGVYDFSSSSAGEVFGRNKYIYYTAEQVNAFGYAPNKPITRTSANEQEIFTYVEKVSDSLGEVGSVQVSNHTCKTYTSSNGKTYVWYLQNEGPWVGEVSKSFGSTFANAGCFATSASTIASGYGKTALPSWSRTIYEFQLTSRLLGSGCPGGVANQLSENQLTEIRNHLKSGKEVIVHVQGSTMGGASRYTTSQHWMPIVDISQDGTKVYNMNTTKGSMNNGQSGWLDIKDVFTSVNCYHLVHGLK